MNASESEARRWFRQAEADLAAVRTLTGAGHFAHACFCCQQAAEKALKAVLYSQGHRVVLGHSVADLLQRCVAYEPSWTALQQQAGSLDQFYVPTRYPNGLPAPAVPSESYTAAQARSALADAERIMNAVRQFLVSHGISL